MCAGLYLQSRSMTHNPVAQPRGAASRRNQREAKAMCYYEDAIRDAASVTELMELLDDAESECANDEYALENDPECRGDYRSQAEDWLNRCGFKERLYELLAA